MLEAFVLFGLNYSCANIDYKNSFGDMLEVCVLVGLNSP